MLILQRKSGESLFIGEDIQVTVVSVEAGRVRLAIEAPRNYFLDNDPTRPPLVSWRAHANLFYSNWLNFYVYQETPFELEAIGTGALSATAG